MNETHIFVGIISVFIVLGIFLPFIGTAFNDDSLVSNPDGLNLGDDIPEEGLGESLSMGTILFSVLKMFFWTFGNLPVWLDSIFLIPRIILAVLIVRWLPVIGSG